MHVFGFILVLLGVSSAFWYDKEVNSSSLDVYSDLSGPKATLVSSPATNASVLLTPGLAKRMDPNPHEPPLEMVNFISIYKYFTGSEQPPLGPLNAQSQMTNFHQITYYWTQAEKTPGCANLGESLDAVVQALGAPSLNDPEFHTWTLRYEYYGQTIGIYDLCVHSRKYILITKAIWAINEEDWPNQGAARVWSDVAYLVYKNDAGNALYAKYLKYVIRLGISAPDTLEVINHFSLAEPLAGITPSDSTTFAGMSLLGTSDGCSLAWMILSHNIYQLMTITTTSIWRDSNGMINMLQELGPTPDPNVPTYGANPQGPDDPGPGGAGRRLMKRQKN